MVDKLDTFAERLKFLRKNAGMSLAAVGKQLGVSAQAAHKWEAGGNADAARIQALAELFRIEPNWLAFGKGELPVPKVSHPADNHRGVKLYNPPTVPVMPEAGVFVPYLHPSAVSKWIEGSGSILDFHTGDWIACPTAHSGETFAIFMDDESMENLGSRTTFSKGDIVFIDPKVKPRTKSCVVFANYKMDAQNVLFRQLSIKDGEMYRSPLNASWPDQEKKVASFEYIFGTAIGKWCKQ